MQACVCTGNIFAAYDTIYVSAAARAHTVRGGCARQQSGRERIYSAV